MNEPANRSATYEDILALPENLVGEILHGRLYTHPRPAPRHAQAYSALGHTLGGPFSKGVDGPGGVPTAPSRYPSTPAMVSPISGWWMLTFKRWKSIA